ncbi:GlsB/YeaQ/YmgE family stress response membrane protein, partial [Acinetobacter baumannii]|nr:GlsB/YeaQ/YmgE family stress response membrane protein [Acinetobacter baumannii]
LVGGFIGGNVLSWFGIDWGGGFWGSLGTALVGSILLLWIWNKIKK